MTDHIERQWAFFKEQFKIESRLSPEAQKIARDVFYAGASASFSTISGAMQPLLDRYVELQQEFKHFFDEKTDKKRGGSAI